MDTRSSDQRRRIMQAVRTVGTGPEVIVRKLLTDLGYRYRLNYKKLPGRPDLVFVGGKKAIYVHGCFWHGHGCAKGRLPKSKLEYWQPKIEANKERDKRAEQAMSNLGWQVFTVWQCEVRDKESLARSLATFLENGNQ